MFGNLDCPLNVSRGLSAIAEFLVNSVMNAVGDVREGGARSNADKRGQQMNALLFANFMGTFFVNIARPQARAIDEHSSVTALPLRAHGHVGAP